VVAAPPSGGFSGNTGERAVDPRGDIFAPLDAVQQDYSNTFLQDLDYMDLVEAAEDEDFRFYNAPGPDPFAGVSAEGGFDQGEIDAVTALLDTNAVTVDQIADQFDIPPSVIQAAYDANKTTITSSEDVYDTILQASAPTDTAGEYLGDVAEAQQDVDIALGNLKTNTGTDVTSYNPAQEAATAAAIDELTAAKENLKNTQQAALDSGLVDEQDLGANTLTQDVLDGVGGVLGAGTRGLYDVASNVPVVGDFLGDAVEGVADFFIDSQGSAVFNPVTGAFGGIWGDQPEWLDSGNAPTIGTIGNTNVGITTGNAQLDAALGILRGDEEIGGSTTGEAVGIDQETIDAAKAAKEIADIITTEDLDNTALTDEEIAAAEKEKNLAIATQVFEEAGGGAEGTQAVLDRLEEEGLTTKDLADRTGLDEEEINLFTLSTPTDAITGV